MNKSIIDPSTLTEEQREAIKKAFERKSEIISDYITIDKVSTDVIVKDLFEWLFGKDFFEKGENNGM